MDTNDYQIQASRTLIQEPGFEIKGSDMMIIWNAIGLAGEAGEVANLVKKGIFHQHGLDNEKIFKELGDVLWYVSALCTTLGIDIGEVMQANIDKLKLRYPNGYNPDDSKKRVDIKETSEANQDKPTLHLK